MNSKWIDIRTAQGEVFTGYLSLPPKGSGPGIVLIQEIWGVNEHIRAVADQYALDGYVVLAPDVFWRLEPRVDLTYDEAGSGKAFGFLRSVNLDLATADIACAVDTLRGLSEVSGKIATLGFCIGGQLSYRVAATGKPDAAVAYYGGAIQDHLALADKISQPILFHYAGLDKLIPQAAVAAVKAKFASGTNATFFDYPDSDHGFNCWGRPAYHQKNAALARGRTLQFLAENL